MKRTHVNELIRDAIAFFEMHQFLLPPFAYWSPTDWQERGNEAAEIIDNKLGWDITDFGKERFVEFGLILFMLRNGPSAASGREAGKPYAEKAMIVGVDQMTPMHHHWSKTEDIINRGGGRLMIKIYTVNRDEGVGTQEVEYSTDGIRQIGPPGHIVALRPGESITLTPNIYHSFWAKDEPVLAGEVSTVNDDDTDNGFHVPVGRFPDIEEDTPMTHLLVSDYKVLPSAR